MASSSRHRWESSSGSPLRERPEGPGGGGRASRTLHNWESPDEDGVADEPRQEAGSDSESDSESEADENPASNPRAASDLLADNLVDMHLSSQISAEQCCVLAYWAVQGGMSGSRAKEMARPPGKKPGSYAEYFARILGLKGTNCRPMRNAARIDRSIGANMYML